MLSECTGVAGEEVGELGAVSRKHCYEGTARSTGASGVAGICAPTICCCRCLSLTVPDTHTHTLIADMNCPNAHGTQTLVIQCTLYHPLRDTLLIPALVVLIRCAHNQDG